MRSFAPTFADVKVYEDLGNVGEDSGSTRVGAVVEYLGIRYDQNMGRAS